MAAPASAASIDCRAISSGVKGRYGDMVGVWIEPVTAQEMMTLSWVLDTVASHRCGVRRGGLEPSVRSVRNSAADPMNARQAPPPQQGCLRTDCCGLRTA